ncbi:MAG: phytanoyl-CoA dioxygenase family protein [Lentisphaeria bacterium]|nr:phytanoyl-CoA dioxygenase family protein [Lentisphaeria bacterium]NQZ68377.1 phytanoyl-CoA dioxygenase family protein [Lentisphaeria bacterium]
MQAITEEDLTQFHRDGYIVLRELIPSSLLADLRKQAVIAKGIIQEEKGGQVQRLQPVSNYAEQLDQKVFQDYLDLPEMQEGINTVLSPRHYPSALDILGIFFEPRERPWGSGWHRDVNEESSRLTHEEFIRMIADPMGCVQVNSALYDDVSTWFVPGSHHRGTDIPGETTAAYAYEDACKNPDASFEECERAWQRHASAMPGGVQLILNAGDIALYRAQGWHCGNYHPSRPRATMHYVVGTEKFYKWWRAWFGADDGPVVFEGF